MKKRIMALLIAFACLSPVFAATYSYSDYQDFKGAITGDDLTPQPGDEFILLDGTYPNSGTITLDSIHGTEANPIIIRAENVGGVLFNDALAFDLRRCSYITIQGFKFELTTKSNVFKVQACNHIRITQNTLDGSTETTFGDPDDLDMDGDLEREDSDWISIQGYYADESLTSSYNRVDHNVFKNKTTLGNIIKIDGNNDIQVSQYDVIDNNYFKNVGPRADNEMETIRIGWSAMSQSDGYCTVKNNLFEECNGDPEIISVKCNKNLIQYNTFRRCAGTVSLRHGNGTTIDGNFFLGEGYTEAAVDNFPKADGDNGSGGIRMYGQDHVITNNYFEGLTGTKWDAPITLTYGDAEADGGLTDHHRIEDVIIANNTLVDNDYGIEIGYDNTGKYDLPPRGIVIAYNIIASDTNSLVNYINAASDITYIDNIVYPTGTAIIGEGTSFTAFTASEATETNPNLIEGSTHYEAGSSTPTYTPSSSSVGSITTDLDGETRSTPTNYGADEYISGGTKINTPLTAADVGPSTGEYVYLSKSIISAIRAGNSESVIVTSNVDWSASSSDTWITVSPLTGSADGSFSVTVAENTSGIERSGSVTVVSTSGTEGPITNTINITQDAVDAPLLNLSTYSVTFSADKKDTLITITSNLSWTATTAEDWITINPTSGTDNGSITVSIDYNDLISERTGSITVSDGGINSKTIAITQAGYVGPEEKIDITSVVASTEQAGNEAVNVFDGDLTNRWSAEGDSVTIDLNLSAIYQVSYLKVGLFKGDERVTFLDIQTSEDGITYTDALMDTMTTITSDATMIFDFDDINAQYVRITTKGTSTAAVPDVENPTGLWNSYTEFEVWGLDNVGEDNADLSEIKVGGDRISNFDAATIAYDYYVPYGTTVVPEVTATTRAIGAGKNITQAIVIGGAATIDVTALDGVTDKTYTVHILEADPSNDSTLSAITVDGTAINGFDAETTSYTFTADYGSDLPVVVGTPTFANVESIVYHQISAFGETATITVTAQDGTSTEVYSITINEADPSAINKVEINTIMLYPNPSKGNFTLTNSEGANVTIFNTVGKLVYSKSNLKLNETIFTELPVGMYFVSVQLNNNQEIIRLIVE